MDRQAKYGMALLRTTSIPKCDNVARHGAEARLHQFALKYHFSVDISTIPSQIAPKVS